MKKLTRGRGWLIHYWIHYFIRHPLKTIKGAILKDTYPTLRCRAYPDATCIGCEYHQEEFFTRGLFECK